jgi:hypothetical protein
MNLVVLRVSGAPPKECLENALELLDKRVRDAVEVVLYEAKVEKILGEMNGRRIDFVREFERHRKPASIALKEFRRYMNTIGSSAPPPLAGRNYPGARQDGLAHPPPARERRAPVPAVDRQGASKA